MELNKNEQMKKLIAALRYTMNALDGAIADKLIEGDIKDNANTLSLDIEELLKVLESGKPATSKKEEKAEKPVKAKKAKKAKKEKATKVKKSKKAKSEKKVAKVKKVKKVAKVAKVKKTKKAKKSK